MRRPGPLNTHTALADAEQSSQAINKTTSSATLIATRPMLMDAIAATIAATAVVVLILSVVLSDWLCTSHLVGDHNFDMSLSPRAVFRFN